MRNILISCYIIWVNENYELLICEPDNQPTEELIEVIEGDGYKTTTYEELNIVIQDTIFK